MVQERQRAADERQRQFMAAILERRSDQIPAATRSTIENNGKSLERAGSDAEEVVLCSVLADDGVCSQHYCRRCMEPRCIILSLHPTS